MGNYVNSNLLTGEHVVREGKLHWILYVRPVAYSVLVFVILTAMIPPGEDGTSYGGIIGFLVAAFLTIPMFISAFLQSWSTELAVTNKRVIAKTGLISRETVELRHEKVESMNVSQTMLGRILNFGTITINGTGGVRNPIKNIAGPMQFRRAALEEIEGGASAPTATPQEA